jgi:hypothetical protein
LLDMPGFQASIDSGDDNVQAVNRYARQHLSQHPVAAGALTQCTLQSNNGDGISANGAPLRNAPGLRSRVGRGEKTDS